MSTIIALKSTVAVATELDLMVQRVRGVQSLQANRIKSDLVVGMTRGSCGTAGGAGTMGTCRQRDSIEVRSIREKQTEPTRRVR